MSRFEKSEWLKLAQDVLKSDGPAALTLERLTAAAGKTRGSFYHHFNSRDEFLRALMLDWQAASLTSLSSRLQTAKTQKARLSILRDVAIEWDSALERQIRYLAAQEPLVAQHLAEIDEHRIQGLASMIRLLRPNTKDAYALAFVQYAALVGGQMLLASEDDPRIPAIRKAGNRLFGLG